LSKAKAKYNKVKTFFLRNKKQILPNFPRQQMLRSPLFCSQTRNFRLEENKNNSRREKEKL
jgi:hypothetical protein